LLRLVWLPLDLNLAFLQCARIIFRRRPDVVLGMGGYIAFPGGMMAALLRRPLVIHEQNSVPGLANRVLARIADRVLCAFPDALGKAVASEWTGNPVREAIAAVAPPAERFAGRSGPLRLLVIGGSLGAQALNTCVPAALARMAPAQRPIVVHQSGRDHLEALQDCYAQGASRRRCCRSSKTWRCAMPKPTWSSPAPVRPPSPNWPASGLHRCWCLTRTPWTTTSRSMHASWSSAVPPG
jgi:UDP-N-acetylglucosamine--N-acetylmuramyl-(pentapeptide) pyrophosphoryl-undecaprenol N-acetylglucosamine transferase